MRYFAMALFGFMAAASVAATDDLLLDDFHSSSGPVWGTRWDGFTDRVMGGLTDMRAGIVTSEEDPFLRIEGRVRTENNGGFLQMRLALTKDGKALDARPWQGVQVMVRGLPGSYAIHLRTSQTWFPWQFYRATLVVSPEWTVVRIPFSEFRADHGAWGTVDLSSLAGVAVVAIGEAFQARLDVKQIGFYH